MITEVDLLICFYNLCKYHSFKNDPNIKQVAEYGEKKSMFCAGKRR